MEGSDSAGEAEGGALGVGRARGDVVEGVVVAFALRNADYPRLLQEVVHDTRTTYGALLPTENLDELAESGRVVVACGLGVAKGLEDRV